MRLKILAFLAVFSFFGLAQALKGASFAAQDLSHSPQLLLTPQRLKRLQRDRERQTVRWVDFENRVQSVPDSPQRGFELALYYAITRDEKRGREAIDWAKAHACDDRQRALVLDWAKDRVSDEDRRKFAALGCAGDSVESANSLRDGLFTQATQSGNLSPPSTAQRAELLKELQQDGMFRTPALLYAACEYLAVIRSIEHIDLREDAPQFFSSLPAELLLALKPREVEHPPWMTHIAALALVSLDPNLPGSQYLQSWAMEDRQMLREGPGVAYELLWADPYLPGVGYQNLDPWVYDENGRLFARTDWNLNACWIAIAKDRVEGENCPADWRQNPAVFGHMTLIPMTQACVVIPHRNNNEVAIVWKMSPHQTVSYFEGKKKEAVEADSAGMWRLPGNVEGKVCVPR